MEKLQGYELLCKKDVFTESGTLEPKLHLFTKGKIYKQIHSGTPNALINNLNQEHYISLEFKKEHFEDIK